MRRDQKRDFLRAPSLAGHLVDNSADPLVDRRAVQLVVEKVVQWVAQMVS